MPLRRARPQARRAQRHGGGLLALVALARAEVVTRIGEGGASSEALFEQARGQPSEKEWVGLTWGRGDQQVESGHRSRSVPGTYGPAMRKRKRLEALLAGA